MCGRFFPWTGYSKSYGLRFLNSRCSGNGRRLDCFKFPWVFLAGCISASVSEPCRESDEQQLLKEDWTTIREGIEVKLCTLPREEVDNDNAASDATETFILYRSRDRIEKDKAIVRRAAEKIETRLIAMQARCEKQNRDQLTVSREIGRLLGKYTRGARLFEVNVLDCRQRFQIEPLWRFG